MAGVSVEGKGGKRRSVDTEVNMVPMIDLMMVTVSFLLITAVWTHAARMNGTTSVPGSNDPTPRTEDAARLHVDVPEGEGPFHISLRRGTSVLDTADLPRAQRSELAARLSSMHGAHPADTGGDDSRTVVLHTQNDLRYADMIAVMDAIEEARDPSNARAPEFRVSLATK
jgi:biopolymer transport protein ExbD